MKEILLGVFAVPQNGGKGFGYAHFVRHPAGNFIPCAGAISDSFDAIAAMGGMRTVVISDRHLGGESTDKIAEHFGASVYCSQIEAQAMADRKQVARIDHALPFARTPIEGGLLLVPTPGHTEGQFSTLAEVEGARILFTADFVWREGGSGDRATSAARRSPGASRRCATSLFTSSCPGPGMTIASSPSRSATSTPLSTR